MRVGEAIQLVKSDIDVTKNPIEINIRPETTKTKLPRTVYVSSETSHILKNRLNQINNNDSVFATNSDPIKAVRNETLMFRYYRKKAGLDDMYSHNGRHKKNIHSFRAFACTQIADVHGDEFAHGYIGHAKYLAMYIRREKEKLAQMFKACESKLMLYEKIEVVDSDQRVKDLELQAEKNQITWFKLEQVLGQISELKIKYAQKEEEIQQLQKSLGKN